MARRWVQEMQTKPCRSARHESEVAVERASWRCTETGMILCEECMARLGADALNRESLAEAQAVA